MRKICLILSAIFFFTTAIEPVNAASPPTVGATPIFPAELFKKIASLKIKDIQKYTGKKLTLKQKISFLLLKQKFKRKADREKDPGQISLTFGVVGVVLLLAGFFLPYVVLGSLAAGIVAVVTGSSAIRKDPDDRKARSGKLLGWITLGVIALSFIAAIIILSTLFA